MTHNKTKFIKNVFVVKNKEKYIGKKTPIYRSSWEKKYMEFLDFNENVKMWCSECVVIPYTFNGGMHKYFPDFLVIGKDDKKTIVEIKPHRETKAPTKSKKKSQSTMLYEQTTYAKNIAKWKAATEFCSKKAWTFKVITEKNNII
jgi:hypothetical protein